MKNSLLHYLDNTPTNPPGVNKPHLTEYNVLVVAVDQSLANRKSYGGNQSSVNKRKDGMVENGGNKVIKEW